MTEIYVDDEGLVVNQDGEYIVDEDGLPMTEDEFDAAIEQNEDGLVDAITPAYHRLRTELGREPTDRELGALLEDAEITGDPSIDKSYTRVTGRPLEPNLKDDDTRLKVFAEYAEEATESDPADAPGAEV